ncbi:glycosyl transferase family 2 [Aurantimonas aggregata]|uniref:Glycosyl transferase family 2 n=1 Tax=Aurantimonas aggregata TaxID=2047720 RepID=A0A6L9MEH4_9HYPH|nr:glycosyl transferase family 2 [Aurantimonas aggregata]NDV86010.1 glycosyl transferase family 2 [Aurantimonas aggregata]
MLTVLMECGTDDQGVAATLATLVPGAVEGVVREVVLVDRGMSAESRKVADHAGCRIVAAADLRQAVTAARGEWLLMLEPGARLQPGWIEAVIEHADAVARGNARIPAARFSRSRADRPSLLGRLRQSRSALVEGFMMPKQQAVGRARAASSLEAMAKGVAVGTLPADIRPAPRHRPRG